MRSKSRGPRASASEVDELRGLIWEIGRKLKSLRDPLHGIVGAELTPPQVHTCMWLGIEGPLATSVLASRIGSPLPATTGIVDRMEKLGLVERARRADDRRIVEIRLSKKGAKLAEAIRTAMDARLGVFLGALSRDDRTSLLGILHRLVDALETPARGDAA